MFVCGFSIWLACFFAFGLKRWLAPAMFLRLLALAMLFSLLVIAVEKSLLGQEAHVPQEVHLYLCCGAVVTYNMPGTH